MDRMGCGSLLWLACCLASPVLAQQVIHVDDDALPSGDGTSWNAAFRCLQDALAVAAEGDDILVAGGVCAPDQAEARSVTPGDPSASFELANGVRLLGGYAGLANPGNPNERDLDLYETVLSGDLAQNDEPDFVNNDENSYNVLTALGVNGTAVLDGFTVSGGNADGACCVHDRGGGLYIEEGSPTLIHCTFRQNAGVAGAAIYVNAGGPTLDYCRFEQNLAISGGAGIYHYNADSELIDCTFADNVSMAGFGGAMVNFSSSLTFVRCAFSDNWAIAGGAIFDYTGVGSSWTDCTFTNNVADSSAAAVYSTTSVDLQFTRCDFVGNTSHTTAGALQCYRGSITLDDCTFTDNRADDSAGAIYFGYVDATLSDCDFAGNGSRSAGAVLLAGGPTEFSHCTLESNSAEMAGAILNLGGEELALYDCTLADNTATDFFGGAIYHIRGVLRLEGCLLSGNSAAGYGGGIYNQPDAHVSIHDCTLVSNQGSGGGAVYNGGAQLDVRNSTFGGNQAANDGGAISNNYLAQVTIVNSMFIGNDARYGGGEFHNARSDVTVTGSTFCDNEATKYGGGMHGDYDSPTLVNCVFWDNRDEDGTGETSQIYCYGDTPTISYSCVLNWSGGWGGTGNIGDDPLFVDPDGPDGDPNTWQDNDYHLTADSPCVDTGDPNGDYTGQTDIDGQNRVWDGDDNGDARIDMGSDEYGSAARGDVNCDGVVNLFDVDAFILALNEPTGHTLAYPACDRSLADINGDGVVDFFDIDPFVALLAGD